MKSKSPLIFPLGIDLIEAKKAKSFYETHKKNLSSFFTKREILSIQRSKKPYEKLALYLAAKEAVFKALPSPRAGILGFRNIDIVEKGRGGISFRLGGLLRKTAAHEKDLRLSFSRKKGYVVATCAGIS